MTQAPAPQGQLPTPVKPQPDVYTVLLIVAILALGGTIGVGLWSLMAELPAGYGMSVEDLFKPWESLAGG